MDLKKLSLRDPSVVSDPCPPTDAICGPDLAQNPRWPRPEAWGVLQVSLQDILGTFLAGFYSEWDMGGILLTWPNPGCSRCRGVPLLFNPACPLTFDLAYLSVEMTSGYPWGECLYRIIWELCPAGSIRVLKLLQTWIFH